MSKIVSAAAIARSDSQVSTVVEGETVVLQLETGNYFSLNEVGAVIWEELSQPRNFAELCSRVLAEYDIDEETCHKDVLALLERLDAEKMIVLR